ncbi:hypothetical protein H6F51_09445 [Cyanobacteria bacterium FACHB-DQ100]|nr:hypothetical protein [Cyanobacteria bacterium FACHB-DQ100]
MNHLLEEIMQERLRQARISFNLAMTATALSFGVSLAGAGLLFTNQFPEGTVTTIGGLASSAHFIRLAKDANDRLDGLLKELTD